MELLIPSLQQPITNSSQNHRWTHGFCYQHAKSEKIKLHILKCIDYTASHRCVLDINVTKMTHVWSGLLLKTFRELPKTDKCCVSVHRKNRLWIKCFCENPVKMCPGHPLNLVHWDEHKRKSCSSYMYGSKGVPRKGCCMNWFKPFVDKIS
jgi:hypothetical protein